MHFETNTLICINFKIIGLEPIIVLFIQYMFAKRFMSILLTRQVEMFIEELSLPDSLMD